MVERVGSKTESGYNFLNLNRLSSVLSRYIDKGSIVKHARDSPRCSRSKRSTITDGKKKISKESLKIPHDNAISIETIYGLTDERNEKIATFANTREIDSVRCKTEPTCFVPIRQKRTLYIIIISYTPICAIRRTVQ